MDPTTFNNAYEAIEKAGLKPTCSNIRTKLGSGSITDISRMLRERRELIEQEAASKKTMPRELFAKAESLVLQLWSAMQVEANKVVTDQAEMATKRISLADASAAEAIGYADDLQGQIDGLQDKLQMMTSELETLRDQNHELDKALATADSRLHEAQKRAAGLQYALKAFRERQVDLFDFGWAKRDPEGYAARQAECVELRRKQLEAGAESDKDFARINEIQLLLS